MTSSPHLNVGLPASSWDNSHSTGVTSRQSSGRSPIRDNNNLKQNFKNIKPLSSHLLKDGLSRGLSVKIHQKTYKSNALKKSGQCKLRGSCEAGEPRAFKVAMPLKSRDSSRKINGLKNLSGILIVAMPLKSRDSSRKMWTGMKRTKKN